MTPKCAAIDSESAARTCSKRVKMLQERAQREKNWCDADDVGDDDDDDGGDGGGRDGGDDDGGGDDLDDDQVASNRFKMAST